MKKLQIKNIGQNINSLKVLLTVLFTIFSVYTFSQPQNKKELQDRKSMLEKDISATNKELNETKKSKSANLKQLVLIKRKINSREELLKTLDSEINNLDSEVSGLNDTIKNISVQLDELKEEYANIIVSTYHNRSATDRLMFLFASKSFNQAFKRLKYLEAYSNHRKEQLEAIKLSQKLLTNKKTELEKIKGSKLVLKDKGNSERLKLAEEKKEKDLQTQKLTEKEKALLAKLEKNQKAVRKLQASIEAIVAEEIRRANEEKARLAAEEAKRKAAEKGVEYVEEVKPAPKKTVSYNSMSITAEDIALTGSFANNKGKLPSPFDRSSLAMGFGEHPHPEYQGIIVKNNGLDFNSLPNAEVKAVFDGVVSSVMFITDLNYVVIIRHGDYLSVYSNLSKSFVKKGDRVTTRQKIGIAANNDDNTKSKLHFELWKGNQVNNPSSWLNI